jgi:hypothetical protein
VMFRGVVFQLSVDASAEGHKMDAIQGARIVVATGSPSVSAIDNV